ncbi:MAG: hypothetical protein NZ805_05325 [Armatimonadetes bacterium]|nr:hypothetical protein [Armatimonadota bacterium]MDW8028021.1 hypothetical protein [Armatimonadota bacterium]
MIREWKLKWQTTEEIVPKLMFVGLGTIGLLAAQIALQRKDVQVVSAVDIDTKKVGQDLGFLTGWGRTHISVTSSIEEALTNSKPDVAVLATSSRLSEVFPTLKQLVDLGVHVVSSTEELFFPWLFGGEEIWMLHELAKDRNVAVVGIGVNPGFVMDRLPAFLAQVCVNLRRVVVRRFVDLKTRRLQLQDKMGVGMTVSEYEEKFLEGKLGHVGLPQSLAFLAASLGMEISLLTERFEPVVDSNGKVVGTEQVASGWEGEYERIRLELKMVLNEPNPRDEIEIDADPSLQLTIRGGIAGDDATAAILVNTASWVRHLPPGVQSGAAWFPRSPLLPVLSN